MGRKAISLLDFRDGAPSPESVTGPFAATLEGLVGRPVSPDELLEARERIGALAEILGGIAERIQKEPKRPLFQEHQSAGM